MRCHILAAMAMTWPLSPPCRIPNMMHESEISAPKTMISALNGALEDIGRAIKLHRVWIALAHEDIGDQHRRTTLGPLWLLVNYLAFVGTFVFVFQPAGKDAAGYSAYVAIGLMVWFYLMEV